MHPAVSLTRNSPPEQKIALFRSLFRGREDIYPRRFENRKTNKSGYAPVCDNEWVRGICEKPRIKCAECSHRRFLPITDQVIRWHLQARTIKAASSSWGSIPCCSTNPASSSRWISTSRAGRTLQETTGRFRLNAELPIPFDSRRVMEVDFLYPEARLVIELDGKRHLADPDAYRRDRRKDALLQQHGYFIPRFLAEDLGKDLDHVLDSILAALYSSQKSQHTDQGD